MNAKALRINQVKGEAVGHTQLQLMMEERPNN